MGAIAVRWRRVEGKGDRNKKKEGCTVRPPEAPPGGLGDLIGGPSRRETRYSLINDREDIVFITALHQPREEKCLLPTPVAFLPLPFIFLLNFQQLI